LTLASSPTERSLRIGVKFVESGSSFKDAMIEQAGWCAPIVAAQVAGDFTLPRDPDQNWPSSRAGSASHPFRSMVKYLA